MGFVIEGLLHRVEGLVGRRALSGVVHMLDNLGVQLLDFAAGSGVAWLGLGEAQLLRPVG